MKEPEQIDLDLDIEDIGGELKDLRIVETKIGEIKNYLEKLAAEYTRKSEFYRIKAESICERIRMIDEQFRSIIGATHGTVEPEPEKNIEKKCKPPTIRTEVKTCIHELEKKGKFTFHDVRKLLRSNGIRVNKKIKRSIRAILAHLVHNKKLASKPKGRYTIYSFLEEKLPPTMAKEKTLTLKKGTIAKDVFLAIEGLEKNNSRVTAASIRNFLVDSGLYTYEKLSKKCIENKITHLGLGRKLIALKTKKGHATTYQYTELGKKLLETLKN